MKKTALKKNSKKKKKKKQSLGANIVGSP